MSGTKSTISGTISTGITLTSPAYADPVTIAAGASLTYAGTEITAATSWTIQNDGAVSATSFGYGIQLSDGGAVTNAASGSIYGRHAGIYITGDVGTVVNEGSISGFNNGVALSDGGTVTNEAGGLITTSTVSSSSFGINVDGGAGTVSNQGSIVAGGDGDVLAGVGVKLEDGGTVSNQAGGYIFGGDYAVELDAGGVVINAASATMVGAIVGIDDKSGIATITNQGTIESLFENGIDLATGGTVINAGEISGANFAIYATGGNLTVELEQGSTINGYVAAAYGGINVLELGSVTGVGTVSGIGSRYTNFGTIEIDPNAQWLLSGVAYSHYGLANSSNATTIVGFAAGDTIDLTGVTFTGESAIYTSGSGYGQLELSNGNSNYYIDFSGLGGAPTFTASDDGSGGTDITMGGAPPPPLISTITGHTKVGVTLANTTYANPVTVAADASIVVPGTGPANYAIYAATAWTIQNEGTLSDLHHDGVGLLAGGAISNAAAAIITGGTAALGDYGIRINGAAGTVTNQGQVTGYGGVDLNAGGIVTNEAGASISAYAGGGGKAVYIEGGTGTLINAGTIYGEVRMRNTVGGVSNAVYTVSNASSGLISNVGLAIYATGVVETVTNEGTILSTGNTGRAEEGILLQAGGTITNGADALISSASGSAIKVTGAAGVIDNQGTITGVDGYAAIALSDGGTVVNGGTIEAGSGVAVEGVNLMVVDPGAVFGGVVEGASGSTLELASASSAGTLSGIGTEFTGFDTVTIDTGASWELGGTNTATTFINDGALTLDPSTLAVEDLVGTGTTTIDTGSTLGVSDSVSAGETIVFNGSGGLLSLGTPADAAGTISGFGAGDTIDLTGNVFNGTDSTTLLSGNVLQIVDSSGTFDIHLDSSLTNPAFFLADDGHGGTDITVACYLRGTLIRTSRGDVAVEDLSIGDLVTTLSGGEKPIKWIGKRSYAGAFAAANPKLWPVLIRAGALADNVPARDLYVSPEHAMYIDKRLIQARLLVNGSSIVAVDDIETIEYFHIELAEHDVIYAEGAAAETFVDCDSRGMFHNAAEFAALYPNDASESWKFRAPMLERGKKLTAIQQRILARAETHGIAARQDGPLEGHLDGVTSDTIHGWARLTAHPGVAVLLEVLNHGEAIGTVLANQFRTDLANAGIGDGRHGFKLQLARPLDPFQRHEISLRRVADRVEILAAPIVIAPVQAADGNMISTLAEHVKAVTTRASNPEAASALLDMLLGQAEQTKQLHAELLRGAGPVRQLRGGEKLPAKRALVIDAFWPRPDRDAGSQAILAHMRGLKRLGWHVSFAAQSSTQPDETILAALRAEGITCHAPPAMLTVEEVLSRQAGVYQLVYLHRNAVAAPYTGLVRHYQPQARIVYNVADLHYLRLGRQAHVEARPELMRHAHWMKRNELVAMRQADAVITHSEAEAAMLAREDIGAASVHVVPWAVKPQSPARGWADRRGMVFVANFTHQPNLDGLNWLVREVMPLVRAEAPEIVLTVAGEGLPAALAQQLARPDVQLLGHVPELAPVYAQARLAVAPLRFGAGLKGKVTEAWAHGLPCAMTAIAAEGLPLEGLLSDTIANDPVAFARLIIRLHGEQACNAKLTSVARDVLRTSFSQKRTDAALAAAIAAPAQAESVVLPLRKTGQAGRAVG